MTMSMGLIFWVLMLLWLVFGFWSNWPGFAGTSNQYAPVGGTVLLFILLLLLGWAEFGAPVR
jgi:hypothetical protein